MATQAATTTRAVDPEQAIADLLDELKLEIAAKLSPEDLARFARGEVALMATIRMEARGKIPTQQAAVWAHEPREGEA